jgi:hypothetical protein
MEETTMQHDTHHAGTRGEHRHPVDFDVYIRFRNSRPFPARARDLSAGGMGLAAESVTLPPYTIVELQFHLRETHYQVQAMVVHTAPGNLSVVFREPQPQALRQAESLWPGDWNGKPGLDPLPLRA